MEPNSDLSHLQKALYYYEKGDFKNSLASYKEVFIGGGYRKYFSWNLDNDGNAIEKHIFYFERCFFLEEVNFQGIKVTFDLENEINQELIRPPENFVYFFGSWPLEGDYLLPYPKHKGKTIDQVLNEDIDYIVWCNDNLEGFCLSPKLLLDERIRRFSIYHSQLSKSVFLRLIKSKDYESLDEYFNEMANWHEDRIPDFNYGEQSLDTDNFLDGFDGDYDSWFEKNQ